MANARETGINPEQEPTRRPQRPLPESSEAAYERLAAYGFARRYVGGKVVAHIGRRELGYGTRLLAETAESVTGLSGSPEALDLVSTAYSAPNVGYRRVNLPELPYPEGHFGVVVAFGTLEELEHPEELLEEAKRVLKEGGVLLLSARDRLVEAEDGRLHEGGADGAGRRGI